ncbi:hypothetical protein [Nostoc sp. 'Lobaria pulmonaria (5183) cyanobiont']|uniref:hypothetical protein n=1 Tax=Nostoc sp. 'Lobaria pulmonaria (5183) cyanobiont' TaxID=1618022 RepID=UPI000CF34986|nr:hypothetical protein [Nostoc sp. 'Lobaria pulmonaria (5183) cyanobiont']
MPKKKYIVSLTSQERAYLDKLTTTGKTSAYKINHARVLLLADTNRESGGWIDQAMPTVGYAYASTIDISTSTIERVRQRFVKKGLEQALKMYFRIIWHIMILANYPSFTPLDSFGLLYSCERKQ